MPPLRLCIALLALGAVAATAATADPTERTAVELRAALTAGELTAESVTLAFLARIEQLDQAGPRLNAVLTINPDALEIARALDRQHAAGAPPGALHGLPVLVKDNIDTGDRMPTTAGSLALADHRPANDAQLVAQLRAAGAVILGKTNLSEWANFRGDASTSGWSSLGGQTRNPYVLDRNPCGSSSGSAVAVAARLAPLAVGTETDGSIACPAGINGIVGIKPTLGTVSRRGIIPIAHSQDTAGPMARTVADAALLHEVLLGADPADPASLVFDVAPGTLVEAATPGRLEGLRIGVYRNYYGAGELPAVDALLDQAIAQLAALGATLVQPIDWRPDPAIFTAEYQVLLHEFHHGLDAYLANTTLPADRNTLARLIEWNETHADRVLRIFGQETFRAAAATPSLDDPGYRAALEAGPRRLRAELEALFADLKLDALVSISNGPAWKTDWVAGDRFQVGSSSLAAVSGLPSVIVPAGAVHGLPIAVSFIGVPLGEATLLRVGAAFEAAADARIEPQFVPTLEHPM
ncbi:MAG: amidase [Pseudomonadales bacterium]|nr:amidase [Pseudomonadales bacterium]